jgi:hypothetical protein
MPVKERMIRAIADFDTVLGFDGMNALGLYGRGRARLKNGDASGGDADIVAARAINSNIAKEFDDF